MLIANPLYDQVFKYLFEDNEIAKGIIEKILGNEIIELVFKPTNRTYLKQLKRIPNNLSIEQENNIIEQYLTHYEVDFKAVIKEEDGTHKTVLIEMQKSNVFDETQTEKFRKYLGENYQIKESIHIDGKPKETFLEIIAIYFINDIIDSTNTEPIIHAKPYYTRYNDNSVILDKNIHSQARLLNHKTIFVQIPYLSKVEKKGIYKLLDFFEQKILTKDKTALEYDLIKIEDDDLKKKIINRLIMANTDKELQKQIQFDIEFENTVQKTYNENIIMANEILQKNKTIDKTIEEKDKTIDEKDKTIEENYKTIEQSILSLYKFIKDPQQIASELGIDVERVNRIIQK